MRASRELDKHLLSYCNLALILLSSFSALSSSSPSFCELQEPLPHFHSYHKAGDFVLGGLFPLSPGFHFPEEDFTTKDPDVAYCGK